MYRTLFKLLGWLSLGLLLLALTTVGLLYTNPGTAWIFGELQQRGFISFAGLQGSIGSGLSIAQLSVHRATGQVSAREVELSTNLVQLALGKFVVQDLSVSQVNIELPPQQTSTPPGQLPDLEFLQTRTPLVPLALDFEHIHIAQLTLATNGQVHTIEQLELAARANQRGVKFDLLKLSYQDLKLEAGGQLYRWPRLKIRMEMEWSSTIAAKPVGGFLSFKGDSSNLAITSNSSGLVVSTLSVNAQDWLDQPTLTIDGKLERFNWTLADARDLAIADMSLHAEGNLSALRFSATGKSWLGTEVAAGFSLQAAVNAEKMDVASATVSTARGNAEYSGSVSWPGNTPHWQGHLAFNNFDASFINGYLPDSIDGELDIAGSYPQQLNLKIQSGALHGQLHGQPFTARVVGEKNGALIRLEELHASMGEASLQGTATLENETVNAAFAMQLPNINALVQDANGSLQLEVSATGAASKPTIKASAHGVNLAYRDISMQHLQLDLDLVEGQFNKNGTTLTVAQPAYKSYQLDTMALQAQGSWRQPGLWFTAQTTLAQLAAAGVLDIGEQHVAGTINTVQLTGKEIGQWQLASPADYRQQQDKWSLTDFCLRATEGRACLAGAGDTQNVSTTLSVTQFPVALMYELGVIPLATTGNLDVAAKLSGAPEKLDGYIRIGQSNLSTPIIITANDAAQSQLSLSGLTSNISVEDGQLVGTLAAVLNKQGSLQGNFSLQDIYADANPLAARLDFEIPELDPYAALFPEIKQVSGSIQGSIELADSLQNPSITANSAIIIPRVYINPLAVEWTDVSASITTRSKDTYQLEFALKAGAGDINGGGSLAVLADKAWEGTLQVHGNQALLVDLPKRRIIANPDLEIAASNRSIDVKGQLVIPAARLIETPSPGRLSLTPDAIIHGPAADHPSSSGRPLLNMNLEVELGDQVVFESYGLKTNVAGKLLLTQKSGGSILGQGELNLVNGGYKAYGQDLKIDRGIIQLTGSLSRPLVNLTASRRVVNVRAGLYVTGPVDNLQTRLFSEPAMNDGEILSYIIRGKPLVSATDADKTAFTAAALSYAVGQAAPVTAKITEIAGIDDIGLEAEQGMETLGLTFGKYITPELYVRYGVGVIDKLSKVLVQYQISDRLYLQSEAGVGQSIDLVYRVQ